MPEFERKMKWHGIFKNLILIGLNVEIIGAGLSFYTRTQTKNVNALFVALMEKAIFV